MLSEDVQLKSEKQNRPPQKQKQTNKMQIKPKGNRNYKDGVY